jgi:hypothetical protein
MKKLIYLICAALLALGTLPLTSCDSKEKTEVGDGNPYGDVQTGWSESGNTMTYTVVSSYGGISAMVVWTFTFTGDECTGCSRAETYPSAQVAQIAWDEMSDSERAGASISGATITFPDDDTGIGFTREELREIMGTANRSMDK